MNIDNDLRNEVLNFSIVGQSREHCLIVYIYMLMYANFKDNSINGVEIKRGQFLTSINILAEKTGLSEKNVRTAIQKLIDGGYIKKYATKKYTIFTICHYEKREKSADKSKQSKDKIVGQTTKSEQNINEQKENRLQELREKAIAGTLTPEEAEEFNNWRR